MKLYGFYLSGASHRATLLLSLLDIPHEAIEVDVARGESEPHVHQALNPFGQIPVLVDGGTVISDSNAILVYLAKKVGPTTWLPESPRDAAEVQRWLSVAAGELANGPAAARAANVFKSPRRPNEFIGRSHALFIGIERWLNGRRWMASITPTIADVALYGDIARAPEGGVDTSRYPAIMAWLGRMEALSGFVPFTRTPVGLDAAR